MGRRRVEKNGTSVARFPLKYCSEEEVYYESKEFFLEIFVNLLVKIFKETVGENRKIFNIELLIRQNFLTITETEEIMIDLFGQSYVRYSDPEYDGDLFRLYTLENEIIDRTMKALNLEDESDIKIFLN